MTPRLSRIGLAIDPWRLAKHISGEGKLEIDFAGGAYAAGDRRRVITTSVR